MTPEHLRYTEAHEWAVVTDAGTVRVGITEHAQGSLGDIVFVSLPDVGAVVVANETCGEIESTKSVAEIYAPVSGSVAARNDVVETSPETINDDPYVGGWLIEITPTDRAAIDGLMTAEQYSKLIGA